MYHSETSAEFVVVLLEFLAFALTEGGSRAVKFVSSTVRNSVGWKKRTFLVPRITFPVPLGAFSHTYFVPKSHVVKVAMLLFRLCAKGELDFLRQGQDGFSRRVRPNSYNKLALAAGLRILAN